MLEEKHKDLNQNLQIPKTENQKRRQKKTNGEKSFSSKRLPDLPQIRPSCCWSISHSTQILFFHFQLKICKTYIFILFCTRRPFCRLRLSQPIPPAGNLPTSVVRASRRSAASLLPTGGRGLSQSKRSGFHNIVLFPLKPPEW